jgi:putative transposase
VRNRASRDTRGFSADRTTKAFWATLKRELAWIHGTTSWAHRDQLRSALFDYIEGFYNPTRSQRRLDYYSPVDYEQHTAA